MRSVRRTGIALFGNVLKAHELNAFRLQRQDACGHTFAGSMRRLVDMGNDDIAVFCGSVLLSTILAGNSEPLSPFTE